MTAARRYGLATALLLLLAATIVVAGWFWAAQQRPVIAALTAEEIATLQRGVAFSSHVPADAQHTAALIAAELDRRRLFAEALRLGLHRQDSLIRTRLLDDAAFLGIDGSEDERIQALLAQGVVQDDTLIRERLIALLMATVRARQSPPKDAELRAEFAATPQRWVLPARWQLRVLAFTGADALPRAKQALALLRAGIDEADVNADDAAGERELPMKSAPRLAASFGEPFVAALPAMSGSGWLGPIAAREGQRLVQVLNYRPPQPMDYAAARGLLLQEWRERQRAAVDQQFIAGLRARYRVRSD